MSSCMELVEQRVLKYLTVLLMIPVHTKSAPDLLLSRLASAYHKSDVFNLQGTAEPYGMVIIDHARIV